MGMAFFVVDPRLRASGFTSNERPFPMRWRRADLRGRVNGNLQLRFEHKGLTSYAGLEFVRRYFSMIGLVGMLRRELGRVMPRSDFGAPTMILVILALLISGGRRLRHLLYLDGDPIVLRFCGLRRLPSARTVGRWLAEFRARQLPRLQWLNALVAARTIRHSGARRLTSTWMARWCRPGFRSSGLTGASILTDARCRATTRSPPTRLKADKYCEFSTAQGTCTMGRQRSDSCVRCSRRSLPPSAAITGW